MSLPPADNVGKFFSTGGTNGLLDKCIAYGCSDGVRRSSGSASLTVKNSIFRCSVATGGTVGMETYAASDRFYNNLVVRASGVTGTAYNILHGMQVRNSIAYKEGTATGTGIYIGHASADVDYCISHGFATDYDEALASKGTHCYTDDPLFDDAGSYDYHVPETSPCIDTGETLVTVTEDLDGVARPQRTAYDIGPYELPNPPPNVTDGAWVSPTSVLVTFDLAMDPTAGSIDDPASWDVSPFVSGDAVTITGVSFPTADTVLLTVSEQGWDTLYQVTAPELAESTFGDVIDVRTAEYVSPVYTEAESADAWGMTAAGNVVDVGGGYYELVPWAADLAYVSLKDAVWLSLFSDRRVEPSQDGADVLPDASGDPQYRGGWWADTYTNDLIGSKLWLLRRSSATQDTLNRARDYASEALQWLVTDGLAARVDVSTERFGNDGIALEVTVSKADGTLEAIRYPDLWSEYE